MVRKMVGLGLASGSAGTRVGVKVTDGPVESRIHGGDCYRGGDRMEDEVVAVEGLEWSSSREGEGEGEGAIVGCYEGAVEEGWGYGYLGYIHGLHGELASGGEDEADRPVGFLQLGLGLGLWLELGFRYDSCCCWGRAQWGCG